MSWLSQALIVRHRTMRSIFVGIIAFSLGAAGTAAAVRGFTSSDNLFHACANSVGSVRVLADGDTCKSSEVGFVFPSQAYVDAVSEAWKQGDATLQTNLDSETAARKQGDATLQTNLDNETAARKQGDTDEAAARKQGDADEAAARKQGDADEAAARQAADTTLQSNLDNETAARKQGDADTLAAGKQYTDNTVANEAAARQAADTTLQNNINNEAAARSAADATLQTNLDNETAARKQADADEAAARRQGDADTLAAANAYTDAHAGGRPALQIISTRVSNAFPLDPGGTLTASVTCPGGKVLIGGGASMNNGNLVLYQSFPASTLQWTASARAVVPVGASSAGLTVYVICMG